MPFEPRKSTALVAKGEPALDPYTFDYLLLCNKICGSSHYNMQMKIVVDTPADYKKWLASKPTIVEEVKAPRLPMHPLMRLPNQPTLLKLATAVRQNKISRIKVKTYKVNNYVSRSSRSRSRPRT
jgi:cytochrome c oxidase subunit 2